MKYKGFILFIPLIIITIIAAIAFWSITSKNKGGKIVFPNNLSQSFEQIILNEGNNTVNLKRGKEAVFPGGAKLTINTFYYDGNANKSTDSITVWKKLKISQKGFIYDINRTKCKSGQVWHEDYATLELIECDYDISISKEETKLSQYYNFKKEFSSLNRDSNNGSIKSPESPIKNVSGEPFYLIIPPYTQLYRDNGLKDYTFTTPIGDIVTVYTNYGFKRFKFKLPQDIFNKASKTEQLGPLTMTLKVKNYSCYPPYLRSSGQCNDPGEYPVYNKIDFQLEINQNDNMPEVIKILDYDW